MILVADGRTQGRPQCVRPKKIHRGGEGSISFTGGGRKFPCLNVIIPSMYMMQGIPHGNSPLRLRETLSHVLNWNSFRNKRGKTWRSHSLGSPIERTPHCDDASTRTLIQRTRSSTHRYNWEPSDPPCA